MAMFLIAGSFRITGAQPDGDSIRFTPDDPAKWDLITGPNRVKRNASGAAQLRLDAIDALETHYGTPRTHQPLGWRMPPPTNCSTGWDSAMSFADKTKRSHPAPPTRWPATSTPARPTSTDAASPSSDAARSARRRILGLRRRRRVENHRQPPPHQHRAGVPDVLPGVCSPICATN